MDRKEIIEKFIEKTKQDIEKKKSILEKNEQARREAPSFMESYSDGTRSEKEMEITNITNSIIKLKSQNKNLKSIIDTKPKQKITTGSIVETEDQSDKTKKYYLMTKNAGGVSIPIISAFSLSKETPLFNCIIDKKTGDIIKFRNREIKILKIF